MEPGREDREHAGVVYDPGHPGARPQWNPAVKTGSTRGQDSNLHLLGTGLNGTRP